MRAMRHQSGLTLLELVVSLLVMTILTSVAITSVSGIQEQARYDKTRRLGEAIVKAIVDINEHSIRGFVADTGRLPDNLRQLLTNVGSSIPNFGPVTFALLSNCSITAYSAPSAVINTTLYAGWSGPYLQASANVNDPDALRDAWGGQSGSEGDTIDYGWLWNATNATLTSYGCDRTAGTTGTCDNGQYEEDQSFSVPWKSQPIKSISVRLAVTTSATQTLRACLLHRDVTQPYRIKALASSTTHTGTGPSPRSTTLSFAFPTSTSIPAGEAFVALILTTRNKTYQDKPLQKIDILPGSYFPVVYW